MNALEIEERALNARRKTRLEYYDREIEKRGKGFSDILRELRDDPLKPWLSTHGNLDQYLQERWGMTARRQRQLLAAKNVREQLADEAPDLRDVVTSMKEGPMREIVATPPAQRAAVVRAAIAEQPKPTAATIKRVKAKVINAATGKPEPDQQMEFRFEVTTVFREETREIAEWFSALSNEQRIEILRNAML